MKFNTIPKTDIEIPAITLGTWVFGGYSWGGGSDEENIQALHCAIDRGINCIDTAPIYSQGDSERIIGKALQGKREKIILATKCGLVRKEGGVGHDLSPSGILDQVEGSLRRLKTDYIDLYQCHAPDPQTPVEQSMEVLLKLKSQGKIRSIGVSNFPKDLIEQALKSGEVVTAQDHYSILVRNIEEEVKPFCVKNDVGILAYGPLAGGILTGKYKEPPKLNPADARDFFYHFYEGEPFKKVQAMLDQLRSFGRPLSQLAINWIRQQQGVSSVLVGCRNVAQVENNLEALSWDLTDDELQRIDKLSKELVHG